MLYSRDPALQFFWTAVSGTVVVGAVLFPLLIADSGWKRSKEIEREMRKLYGRSGIKAGRLSGSGSTSLELTPMKFCAG